MTDAQFDARFQALGEKLDAVLNRVAPTPPAADIRKPCDCFRDIVILGVKEARADNACTKCQGKGVV